MLFNINGERHELSVDVRTSLLDLLREHLQLTGSKKGCNQGACGACTVLVNGVRINSCLALAVQYQDAEIVTVEGLAAEGLALEGSAAERSAKHDGLHPLQRSFVEHDGFQCGYCTPGQMCSAIGMLGEIEAGVPSIVTDDLQTSAIELNERELRERMSGNLCRCGAYNGIVQAIQEYAVERSGSDIR